MTSLKNIFQSAFHLSYYDGIIIGQSIRKKIIKKDSITCSLSLFVYAYLKTSPINNVNIIQIFAYNFGNIVCSTIPLKNFFIVSVACIAISFRCNNYRIHYYSCTKKFFSIKKKHHQLWSLRYVTSFKIQRPLSS